MPDLAKRMASLEADPAFKSRPPDKQAALREALKAKVAAEYEALKEEKRTIAGQQRESMEGAIGPMATGAIHSGVAGLIGRADAATFGYAPKIISAFPGTGTEEEIRASMDVAQEQHPIASGIGAVSSAFGGGVLNPAGMLQKGAGSLAAKVVPGAALAAALPKHFASRAAIATLKNIAGGAGAIMANAAVQSSDESLGDRLSEAAWSVLSPTNLALSAVAGGVQAKLARPPSASLASAVARYERITGKKVPIETLTGSAAQKKFYDLIAHTAGMDDVIQSQKKEAVSGLRQVVESLRSRAGGSARKDAGSAAAAAVRALPGDLAGERRKATSDALNKIGRGTELSDDLFATIEKGWKRLRATRAKNADAGALDAAFSEVVSLKGKGIKPTLREFEELRKKIGDIGYAKTLDGKTVGQRQGWEGRRAYDLLHAAALRHFPEYGEALSSGKTLRAMEQAVDAPVTELDDAMMSAFFTGPKPITAWKTLVRGSHPNDISAAKGWLFNQLISRVATPDGMIDPEKLRKITSGRNKMLNKQLIDEVLPGLLPELEDHAQLTVGMLARGSGRFGPEGSQTAGRVARGLEIVMKPAAATGAVTAAILGNPLTAVATIIGPTGVKLALRSALNGQIGDALQNLSRQGPQPLTRSAVAAQRVAQPVSSLLQGGTQ